MLLGDIMDDVLSSWIEKILFGAGEPLETKEIEGLLIERKIKESITRTKVFYRLNLLRGEGRIKGKFIGPGKGVWIWWLVGAFEKDKRKGGR